jgi:hypothetical protein
VTAKRTPYPTRRYNLITDDHELAAWRQAAAAARVSDLATWLRQLAWREVERVKRQSAR